jgi:hypothetical protein
VDFCEVSVGGEAQSFVWVTYNGALVPFPRRHCRPQATSSQGFIIHVPLKYFVATSVTALKSLILMRVSAEHSWHLDVELRLGRGMVQAVNRRLPTAAAPVRSQVMWDLLWTDWISGQCLGIGHFRFLASHQIISWSLTSRFEIYGCMKATEDGKILAGD